MALSTVTVQPNSSPQRGSWSIVNAATAWGAVSDSSDTTYLQLSSLCRLDNQVARFGFPAISIPAGARVYSVGLRRRVQCVIRGHSIPQCLHWFRCTVGAIAVGGQLSQVFKTPFNSPCPTDPSTNAWTNENLFTATIGPDGQAWNLTKNLAAGNFYYDMGRSDDFSFTPLRVSEVYLDVTFQQVSTIAVSAPTGTVTDTKATVQWQYSSADSQPQQGYQVAVYTQAQTVALGFVPFVTTPIDGTGGFLLGENQQWIMNTDLTNGDYVAYVQASSQWAGPGDFLSGIGSTSWSRSSSAPPPPGSTSPPPAAVLSSATFDADNNRVALTFLPSGASPATTSFTVSASRDGGQSWAAIPSMTYLVANGMTPVTAYDYVAPLNIESQYRVLAYGGDPLQGAGSPSNVRSVTPVGNAHWLKSPTNPLLNSVLPVAAPKQSEDGIKITKRRLQGTFQLLGGPNTQVLPFVVSGPTYGDEYAIELIFIEGDANTPMTLWQHIDELDRSGDTLLLQKPDGTQLWVVSGPGASGQETEETYNSLQGDPTVTYWRRRKLVLTQVDPPLYF